MSPTLALVLGIVAIVLWIVFTFVLPTGIGATHLLAAAGAPLLVYWWGKSR